MPILAGKSTRASNSLLPFVLVVSFLLISCGGAGGPNTQGSSAPRTVNGTWIDTYWKSSGPVGVPFDWTKTAGFPKALVPQSDGSFQAVTGSGRSDGSFTVPNVPGGYFWFQPTASASYWTSSGAINLGSDLNGQVEGGPSNFAATTFTLNFAGLDPLQTGDEALVIPDFSGALAFGLPASSPAGATALSGSISFAIFPGVDYSKADMGWLLQYEPETLGTLGVVRLGAEGTLPGLTLVNGALNTISGALVHSPQTSFDLSIRGTAWVPLFSNAGPSPATVVGSDLALSALPFLTASNVPANPGLKIPMVIDQPSGPLGGFALGPVAAGLPTPCIGSGANGTAGFVTSGAGEPAVETDQDFGPVEYGDPFPVAWPRVFTFCQTFSFVLPIPDSTSLVTLYLTDAETIATPTSQIAPLITQVQNPTIDGLTLFAANTVSAEGVTLSWNAPSGLAPTGYRITALAPILGIPVYGPAGSFYTTKTSMTLPPLAIGQTYVFLITSILDGAANFESSPNRSSIPAAEASVVSAPITTGP